MLLCGNAVMRLFVTAQISFVGSAEKAQHPVGSRESQDRMLFHTKMGQINFQIDDSDYKIRNILKCICVLMPIRNCFFRNFYNIIDDLTAKQNDKKV